MKYRMGVRQDFEAIAQYLHDTEYFFPVDMLAIGGHWVIAEHDDKVRGVIWCFVGEPHAYIDYWAGSGPVVSANLLNCMKMFLEKNAIRYVHGAIHAKNPAALRLATKGFDVIADDTYHLIYKELDHGAKDNHDELEHDTGSECTVGSLAAIANKFS